MNPNRFRSRVYRARAAMRRAERHDLYGMHRIAAMDREDARYWVARSFGATPGQAWDARREVRT